MREEITGIQKGFVRRINYIRLIQEKFKQIEILKL